MTPTRICLVALVLLIGFVAAASRSQSPQPGGTRTGFVVCSSITLRGHYRLQRQQLSRLRNCSLIVGHLRLVNFAFGSDDDQAHVVLFPHLVEITDYLLVFGVRGLASLARVAPRLAVVRGHRLFRRYALVVFLADSLRRIDLPMLMRVERGSVLVSRLYHACFLTTVDWSRLLLNEPTPTTANFTNKQLTKGIFIQQ